jgi:hypothetical protein
MHSIVVISYVALNSFLPKCLKCKAALRGGIPPLKATWKIRLTFKVKL